MLLVKFVKWTPLVQVLFLVVGISISFSIALFNGNVNLYLPFISETGAYSPEKCFFSLFLILGSFIGCIVVTFRFLITQNKQDQTYINFVSFIFGLGAMFGLAGVAAFPMTTVFTLHLAAASIYFVSSLLYFVCATFMTWKDEGRSRLFITRCSMTIILQVLLVILVICFPLSLKQWHEFNTVIPALKEPENEGFTLMLISSVVEWAIATIIAIFTLTFIIEMSHQSLLLIITPIKEECDQEQGSKEEISEVTEIPA